MRAAWTMRWAVLLVTGPWHACSESTPVDEPVLQRAFAGFDSPAGTHELRRLHETGVELYQQGTLWDSSPGETTRPDEELARALPDGRLEMATEVAVLRQLRVTSRNPLRLLVDTEGTGTATISLMALRRAVPDLATTRRPIPMQRQLLGQLASEEITLSRERGQAAVPFEMPGEASHLLVAIGSGTDSEMVLERVSILEEVPAGVARRPVGGEVRPAVPIPVDSSLTLSLPSARAGSTLELGWAPIQGSPPVRRPLRLQCRLRGPDHELTDVWEVEEDPAPVRRFRDLVLRLPRGLASDARMEVEVESEEPGIVLLSEPLLRPPPPARPRPNVLLISIDTLRADRLGCYGNPARLTPNLDRLAARGVRFERAYSTSNYTLAAHASLMTALDPRVHGAEWRFRPSTIRHLPSLARTLAGAGFLAAAFTGGGYVDPMFGFDEGFDRYDTLDVLMSQDNVRYRRAPRHESPEYNERLRARSTLDDVLAWLRDHQGDRFFVFLHTYHAHDYCPSDASREHVGLPPHGDETYAPPAAIGSARGLEPAALEDYRLRYDATVRDVDRELGRLFQEMEELHLWSRTVVLVTSDHGEALGEHDLMFHGRGLYQELLRVPLLLAAPGIEPGVVKEPVSLVDVAPTLLELAGCPPLPDTQGRSLLPLIERQDETERPLLAHDYAAEDRPEHALVGPRLKLIRQEGGELLFDLLADPRELEDLSAREDARLEAMKAELSRALAALPRPAASPESGEDRLDPELAERLRQLGYVDEE